MNSAQLLDGSVEFRCVLTDFLLPERTEVSSCRSESVCLSCSSVSCLSCRFKLLSGMHTGRVGLLRLGERTLYHHVMPAIPAHLPSLESVSSEMNRAASAFLD